MAKKSSIKVRLVPESKPNSPYFYYVKKPSAGEKAKIKLKVRNITQLHVNMKFLLRKNYPHIANNYFFLKFLFSKSI